MRGNLKRRKRKSDYWFFSLLLLCVTQGASCEIKRPQTMSLFSTLTLLSLLQTVLFFSSFSSSSSLSCISIPLLCQISILICLQSPPLQSPTDPPPCIFFCLTAAPQARGSRKEVWQPLAEHLQSAAGWEDEGGKEEEEEDVVWLIRDDLRCMFPPLFCSVSFCPSPACS